MKIFTRTVGHDAPLTAYVQEPSEQLGNATVRPAVLVLPGGGYFVTSDREAEPVALAYLAEGFNAFVLRYSVGAESPFEQSFDDAKAALAWIRENAAELHIDPTKVVVVGFSAGGHLAASLATVSSDKPDVLVVGYPVTLEEFGPPVGKDLIDIPSHVTPQTPPTFLFSTSDDTVVPIRNSLALLSALADAEVLFESHIYMLGPHGLSLATAATANGEGPLVEATVAQWFRDSVRFIRSVLGDFPVEGEQETYSALVNRRQPGLDMRIGKLLQDDRMAEALRRHAPDLVAAAEADVWVKSISLNQVLRNRPDVLTPDAAAALERDLRAAL